MRVKVLGSGCANCEKLSELVQRAGDELGLAEELHIEKVTDPAHIATYGIMATPGFVVDEEVKAAGRVPSYSQIKQTLAERRTGGEG